MVEKWEFRRRWIWVLLNNYNWSNNFQITEFFKLFQFW